MIIKQYFKAYSGMHSSGLDFDFCPRCGAKLAKKEIDNIDRMYCETCQYIQYINPSPGISVLVINDRTILIGKRAQDSTGSDKWCLPCGFIEHHENFLDAAHREVYEETGLEIEIKSLVNVVSNHINPDLHTIVPVLTASVVGGHLRPGDDIKELSWLSDKNTFPEMAFEADKFIIQKYFKNELTDLPVDERFFRNNESRSNY